MAQLTVGAVLPRVQYLANGIQRTFPVPFPFFAAEDLSILLNELPGVATYTVAGEATSNGGSVTFIEAPPAGQRLTILRAMPLRRLSDFQEAGDFRAEALNEELDRLTMMVQQVDERAGRAVSVSAGSVSATPVLPPPGQGYLRWNADGTALELDASLFATADAIAAADRAAQAAAEVAVQGQVAADEVTLTRTDATISVKARGIDLDSMAISNPGEIFFYSTGGLPARLAPGAPGEVLKSMGPGADPAWASVTGTPDFILLNAGVI